MAFNSFHFLIFFPVVLTLFFAVRPDRRWLLLFLASCYFYMAWRPEYILLILGESALAYFAALAVARTADPGRRKLVLSAAISTLVAVLFVFKYVDFVTQSVTTALRTIGLDGSLPAANLILPLGISFHTFILIGYLIDVHRKKMPPESHPGIFGVFSIFFPLLVAGPIERADTLLPQFHRHQSFDAARLLSGFRLMAWGFFKKVVVADRLSPTVDNVYSLPQAHDGPVLVLATVFFAMQIYCDFSGYTDIARGAARTMGINLMKNFDRPYAATSIAEFWKRWHISLSTWLTDYVYASFTRARWLKLRWYPKFLTSLMLTFLVSGVWHGAAWTYVLWGALHGTYLVTSVLTQNLRRTLVEMSGLERVPLVLWAVRVAMTFSLVCLSYIFFRAASVADALYIVTHLASPASVGRGLSPSIDFLVAGASLSALVLAVDTWAGRRSLAAWVSARPAWQRWSLDYGIVTATLILGAFNASGSFIYFQF